MSADDEPAPADARALRRRPLADAAQALLPGGALLGARALGLFGLADVPWWACLLAPPAAVLAAHAALLAVGVILVAGTRAAK